MQPTSDRSEPDSASPKVAEKRRFQFSLRTLLIGVCLLCVLLAATVYYLAHLQTDRTADRAISYLESRDGQITIGSPNNATAKERIDVTDPRNTVSVSFPGTTLVESDYEQLAKVPTLTSLTISDAPVSAEGLSLLRQLPSLQFLVLENTGVDDSTLKKIKAINPQWRVFTSGAALRKWSLEKFKK